MTTHPAGSQSQALFVDAAGVTYDHADEHGRSLAQWVSAKQYLRGDGTTEDATQITTFQTAAAGKRVHWPTGTYAFPDGVGLTLADHTHHVAANHRGVTITVKNAYAFSSTGTTNVKIEGFTVQTRSGSTTGGAVKTSGSNNNSWFVRDVYGDGVSTLTQPMFDLAATIGMAVEGCTAGGAPVGFYWHVGGWFCNTNSMYRCRVVNASNANTMAVEDASVSVNAGILIDTALHIMIRDTIVESCYNGYGLYGYSAVNPLMDGMWFEANLKDNVHLKNSSYASIVNSKFHGMTPGDATADHIDLERSTGSGSHESHYIAGNHYQDSATSGLHLKIGTNVEYTTVVGGDIPWATVLSDSGTGTMVLGNQHMKLPGPTEKLKIVTTRAGAALSSADPNSNETIFLVSDDANENYMIVGSIGAPIFVTKNLTDITTTESLATKSFVFYWDESAGQIKARVRKNDGSYTTLTVA